MARSRKSKLLGGPVFFLASLGFGLMPNADAQGQQQVLVIQGGTLIDGNGGAPVPNSAIVIQGNRISAVGRAGQVQVPAGAGVIDATGKFVTPGMIDAMAGGYWMYGEGYLHFGITSVVVNAARGDEGLAMRDAINHGIIQGPRMFQTVLGVGGRNLKSADDALCDGRQNRLPQQCAQFWLPDQEPLQFASGRIQVRQQSKLFEHVEGQRLGLVHHDQCPAALCMGEQQVPVDQID